MVSHSEEVLLAAEFRLVRTDDGRVLMSRRLRAVDAELFNRRWLERGIPTRWEPAQTLAALAG